MWMNGRKKAGEKIIISYTSICDKRIDRYMCRYVCGSNESRKAQRQKEEIRGKREIRRKRRPGKQTEHCKFLLKDSNCSF